MKSANLLQELLAVGQRAYPLNDEIRSVEPMFEFLARALYSDVLSSLADHVTNSELAEHRMSISVPPLS